MTNTLDRHDEGVAKPPTRGRYLAARTITEVFAPTVFLAAGYTAVIAATAPTIGNGLVWAAVAVLLGSVLPFLFVLVGVHRGRIGDHHIRVRSQRHIPTAIGLACVVAGLSLLFALNASRGVIVLFVLVIAAVVPCMAVTVWWKISVHTAVAGLIVAFSVVMWGLWLVPAVAVVAAVGWSRVVLDAHTPAQVWAGAALGTAIGVLAWPLLG